MYVCWRNGPKPLNREYPNKKMSVLATKALDVLKYNHMEVDRLLTEMTTHEPRVFMDEDGDTWTFIMRRCSRLFLMAKTVYMNKYEEVYVTSK